ncbi:hypothetical protein H8B02_42970 [Bradyrhizobium sp. Pear77]|uniref:hypothetical protein n=1 Tax=Bradyrhizobium altum TaxID=1571202 RepID=UPI001E4D3C79|nr:hypothetical protein [Bradyrhizobium altum]MCC8959933.1 hypothetical protein [Bradyrhizobium altum]
MGRRVVIETDTLAARLAERAKELRGQADELAPGGAKDTLLELAQFAETSAHMSRYSASSRIEAVVGQDMNRFSRGERVQLKRPYAKAITRKNRTPDWLKRKGIVQGFKQDFIYIRWDGRRTIEQVPIRAVEKAGHSSGENRGPLHS